MTTLAEVRLWGRTIGAVSLTENNEVAAFQYDPSFVRSGIQLAPLVMPLSNRVYRLPYGSPGQLGAISGLRCHL